MEILAERGRDLPPRRPRRSSESTITIISPASDHNRRRRRQNTPQYRSSSNSSIHSASSYFGQSPHGYCLSSPSRQVSFLEDETEETLGLLSQNLRQMRRSIRQSRQDIFGVTNDGTRLAVENVREIKTYVHELVDSHNDPFAKLRGRSDSFLK